jgi:hypothetical protein
MICPVQSICAPVCYATTEGARPLAQSTKAAIGPSHACRTIAPTIQAVSEQYTDAVSIKVRAQLCITSHSEAEWVEVGFKVAQRKVLLSTTYSELVRATECMVQRSLSSM